MRKRTFLTVLVILMTLIGSWEPLSAQVRFSSKEPEFEMTAKRLGISGDVVTITGTIVWQGRTDCFITCPATGVRIVDDEGVVYDYKNIRFDIGNTTLMTAPNGFVKTDSFILTAGVPFRFKLIVSGIDEYARAFELVELTPSIDPGRSGMGRSIKVQCRSLQFPPVE